DGRGVPQLRGHAGGRVLPPLRAEERAARAPRARDGGRAGRRPPLAGRAHRPHAAGAALPPRLPDPRVPGGTAGGLRASVPPVPDGERREPGALGVAALQHFLLLLRHAGRGERADHRPPPAGDVPPPPGFRGGAGAGVPGADVRRALRIRPPLPLRRLPHSHPPRPPGGPGCGDPRDPGSRRPPAGRGAADRPLRAPLPFAAPGVRWVASGDGRFDGGGAGRVPPGPRRGAGAHHPVRDPLGL
ncbi:MAG: hypothetical protein AVDCRST_MAG68-2549, partial [uncultured Gemmatimonadetes bacterium]